MSVNERGTKRQKLMPPQHPVDRDEPILDGQRQNSDAGSATCSPTFPSAGSTLVAADSSTSGRTGTAEVIDDRLSVDAATEHPSMLLNAIYDDMEVDESLSSSEEEPWLRNYRIRGLLKEDRHSQALVRFSFGPTDIGSMRELLDLIAEEWKETMDELDLSMTDLIRVEGYSSFRSEVRRKDAGLVAYCDEGTLEEEDKAEQRWQEFFRRAWEDEMYAGGYEADDEKEDAPSSRETWDGPVPQPIEVKIVLFFC